MTRERSSINATATLRAVSTGASRSGHTWALALSASLVLIVCIRFFSESVGLLPRFVQFVDVPITAILSFCALLAFIRRGHQRGSSKLGVVLFIFVLVSLVSALMGSSRVQFLPTAMFLFNFSAPLIVAIVCTHAPLERADVGLVLRTFFWLGVVQLAVSVLYGLPRFVATHDPDQVSGTFGMNAYQFTYFIGLWLLFVLGGTVDPSRRRPRGQTVAVALAAVAVFGLFYAAQYRAMLLFFPAVILITLWVSPARASKRVLMTVVVSAVSIITLVVVATSFPSLKLLRVFDLFEDSAPIVQSGKVQAAKNVLGMYEDVPQALLVGSGPATFSSRAYMTFAYAPRPEKTTISTYLVGSRGGQLYNTDVATKYVASIRFAPIQGGTTMSNPQSSYISLAAEVGLAGLVAYLAAYAMALVYAYRRLRLSAKAGDTMTARLAFTCVGGLVLLLIQGLFDNWLDTTRVAIPLWTLVGLLYALEKTATGEPRKATGLDDAG